MNHYGMLRIVLALGIVAVVFWLGIKVGQFSSEINRYGDRGYGSDMMQYHHGGYGMMQPDDYYYDQSDPSFDVPDTSVSAPSAPQSRAGRATPSTSKTQ